MTGKARAQVLEMLAAGDITIEQADQLLDALDEEPAAGPEPEAEAPSDEGRIRRRFVRRERVGRNPDFDQLIGLAMHGVTPGFIREVREAGLEDLTTDEVVELAIHGVEPGYIRRVKTMGWDVRPREIVQLAIHGIGLDYLEKIKDLDLDLDIEQVVQMGVHGIEPDVVVEWSKVRADERAGARVRVERVFERTARAPRPPVPPRPPMPPRPPAPPARPAAPAAPASPTPPADVPAPDAPPKQAFAPEPAPAPEFHDGNEER